jgi:multidrug efflux pump
VPITQIAEIRYEQEDGIRWRRDRLPTVTVRADVLGDAQGPELAILVPLPAPLELGVPRARDPAIEHLVDAAPGRVLDGAGVPLMMLVIVTLLVMHKLEASRAPRCS